MTTAYGNPLPMTVGGDAMIKTQLSYGKLVSPSVRICDTDPPQLPQKFQQPHTCA